MSFLTYFLFIGFCLWLNLRRSACNPEEKANGSPDAQYWENLLEAKREVNFIEDQAKEYKKGSYNNPQHEKISISSENPDYDTSTTLFPYIERNFSDYFKLNPPEILCEDTSTNNSVQDQNKYHKLVLKWTIGSHRNTNQNFVKFVYLLEGLYLKPLSSKWKTYGKTNKTYIEVNVPYEASTLKWRITAVGSKEIIRKTTSTLSTLNGFVVPGLPRTVFISNQVIHNDSLDVEISWEPSEDKPCYYKIICTRVDGEETFISRKLSIVDFVQNYSTWFTGLTFNKIYDFSISTRRGKWSGYQSTIKSTQFKMISCLKAHNSSFTKCKPPSPRNLSQEYPIENGNIKILWYPPQYTSKTNLISNYTLFLGSPFHSSNIENYTISYETLYTESTIEIIIPGNETGFTLTNLRTGFNYMIALMANTEKGNSDPIYLTLSTHSKRSFNDLFPEKLKESSIIQEWHILIGAACGLSMYLSLRYLIKFYFKQREDEHEIYSVYFRNSGMEHRSNGNFISNTYHRHQTFKPQFETTLNQIPFKNLRLKETLGQGSFGIVKKAHLFPSKLEQTHQGKHEDFKIVAVKMLKVLAISGDQIQLINELETMQKLEKHDQIVTLLGVSLRKQAVFCIVLEYCAGGDLLSYLRKIQEKYYQQLGFYLSTNDSITQSLPDQSVDPVPFSQIAGFITNSKGSISKESESFSKSNTCTSVNTPEAQISSLARQNSISEREKDKILNSINEMDIFSYARQISMGMEYLERNKIVHRDLALRNVLLLGNYKEIKIGDFGLSRDVYYKNYYERNSTDGKLPIRWMAIESILDNRFSSKSDVWSFGIVLYELVTLGGMPYPGFDSSEIFDQLKQGYRIENPGNCSDDFYDLMRKCWKISPSSRPNFIELKNMIEFMMETNEPFKYIQLELG